MLLRSLIAFFCLLFLSGCKSSVAAPGPELPFPDMREGDLAFRCGQGVFSRAVTSAQEDPLYSHVGVLVRDGEVWKVVHAVPAEPDFPGDFDRVKAEPVSIFFAPGRAYRGCLAHTGLSDSLQVSALRASALRFAADSVRFDNGYSLEDSSSLYCTELVWRLYRRAGIDLSEGRRRRLDVFRIHADCLLPEHLYTYSANQVYFQY